MNFIRAIKPAGWVTIVGVLLIGVYFGLKTTGLLNKLVPPKRTGETLVPDVGGVSTPDDGNAIRIAHWTWNAHQALALANGGKSTTPDSINAKNGVTVQFLRIEDIPSQIAALKKFAQNFEDGEEQPTRGAHFFTIMGDAAGMVLTETNKALKDVDSDYRAEIIAVTGFSAGEDKFMGPPEWKSNPRSALGGIVSGVPADGDWNIMIFWAAQNKIPFNSDPILYDPQALNFVKTDDYIKAGEIYIANKPIERVFTSDGKDCKGNPVKKDEKGYVCINGVVTWTPVDKMIAEARGGIISIVSTKEYSNQMPQYVVGFKQWNEKNSDKIRKLLRGTFTAADLIVKSDVGLERGTIQPKSAGDYRWKAAVASHAIFESETPEFWYKAYESFPIRDKQGLSVDIGGSAVANYQRNVKYFGMDGSTNIGEIVYMQFSKLAKLYYPDMVDKVYPWAEVFNPSYLRALMGDDPELAATEANLPTFGSNATGGSQVGELEYRLKFDSGRATFQPGAESTLKDALEQLAIAANTRVEIHGHTDSAGDPNQNMTLSKHRAEAVYNWLRSRSGASFPANRVRVVPHGQNDPVAVDFQDGNFIEENAEKNRRVVIKIFKK